MITALAMLPATLKSGSAELLVRAQAETFIPQTHTALLFVIGGLMLSGCFLVAQEMRAESKDHDSHKQSHHG